MRTPPERIYGWLDSHLSIARFYGGITYEGHSYTVDLKDPERPLVRTDVLEAERRAQRAIEKRQEAAKRQAKRNFNQAQNDFFNEAKS